MKATIVSISFSFEKGISTPTIANPEAITFKKAVAGGYKAPKVLNIVYKLDDGFVAINNLSLRQVHNAITRMDLPSMKGIDTLPKERKEEDKEGAAATATWLRQHVSQLRQLADEGKLFADFSRGEDTADAEGNVRKGYPNANGIYVNDSATSGSLAAEYVNFTM